ncbi:hypothetical protein DEJ17_03375 [Curtobacterium sp. MCSS17_011]|uniref:hypothetical protein n=1 Tax=Curtobacterium sp. MCSS17_011 TaxID=2175643 RepID=UPI000D816F77|nr:hypothetical protein [Curtobacterium sp. MCSS17_011]PYY61770.1 hypothetical protein DEJ17_03375 [Curtobacterium sp. MCSS17_011]
MNTTRTTTRRNRTLLAVAAATVLLPGLLTACSGGAPGGGAPTTAGTAAKGASLAECMRDRGYDLPDPGSGSTLQLSAPDGVDEEQYQEDLRSCLDDTAGAGDAEVAEQAPGDDERVLRTAECIRERGFSDYPDDEDAKIRYQPDDEDAFDEVARACDAAVSDSAGAGVAR